MEDKKMLNDEELENVNGGVDNVLADSQVKSIPDREEEVDWGTKVPEKLPDSLWNTPDYPTQSLNSDKSNNDKNDVGLIGVMHS